MEIEFGILLAQIINFGILFLLFKKFVADALVKQIDERREKQTLLDNAQTKYDEMLAQAQAEKQAMLDEARSQSEKMMLDSERIAKKQAQKILDDAEQSAKAIVEGGRRELEKEKKSLLSEMKSHILGISMKINEKVFSQSGAHKEFLESEVSKIG